MESRAASAVPIYPPSLPEPEPRRKNETSTASKLWLIWRDRRLFWSVSWKTTVLATVVAFLLPVHYEAAVKIVPGENNTSGMNGLAGRLASIGGSNSGSGMGLALDATGLLGLKTPAAFYVEILKSRSVQDRIIDRFNLRVRYSKTGKWFPKSYYETRKTLKSFTSIEEDKKSNVITVSVTDYDRNTAAQIANDYVQEVNKVAADLNTGDAHRERVFLEERLRAARADLDAASLALSQYSSRNAVMDPQNEGKAVMDAAARVQGEIIAVESELKGLQQIYSDDNVRVRTLKARLQNLQAKLRSMTGAGQTAANTYPSMTTLPLLGYRYSELYRENRIQEAIYEFLTQQYETAKIQEAKELPTVRVMDPAVPPEKKSGPIRSLIVAASVVGAIILTVFWVLGKNSWYSLPADDSRRLLAAEIGDEIHRAMRKLRATAS